MAAKSKREKLNISFFQRPEDEIKKNITIDEELQNLIPPLAGEEFAQLQQNILTEGCREPLTLWHHEGQYILVDGHNRYRICTSHQIRFNVHLRDFDNKAQAKDWMIANQLGRRNLTPLQQSYLRGKCYANEKQAWGGIRQPGANGHNVHLPSGVDASGVATMQTASRLATEYGVNEKTIRRDAQFAHGLERLTRDNSELRWKILNGQIKAGKKTITGLTGMPLSLIASVSKKLPETGNLEKAIRLLQKTSGSEDATVGRSGVGEGNTGDKQKPGILEKTATFTEIQQQIMVTVERAIRTAHDPQQSRQAVATLKNLVRTLEQVLREQNRMGK